MNRIKGFLLLEVVMCIVIVTAGLLFIIHSYSSSKDSVQLSTELFKTSLLLEEAIWKYEVPRQIESGFKSGDFMRDDGYSWSVDVIPVSGSTFNHLTVSVFKKDDPQNTKYSMSTYLTNKSE